MKRVLTAILLIPAATWVVFWGHPFLFIALAALVATGCFVEFARITAAHGAPVNMLFGIVAGLPLVFLPSYEPVLLVLPVLLAMAWQLRSGENRSVLLSAAALSLALVYCFGPWRAARELRVMGPYWLFYAMALNWIGDTAAFFVGSRIGKHKLAPSISPAKSWEGLAASVIASMIFGVAFLGRFAPERSIFEVCALSAVANIAGQIGDLCESAMKRGAGIKDSGSFLPGHGGWLDRLDSSLFAMPVVYAWLARNTLLQ